MNNTEDNIGRNLDRVLDMLPDPALPVGLRDRVLHARPFPAELSVPAPAGWSLALLVRSFWPQAIGLAAASMLGFISGITDLGVQSEPATDFTSYILALDVGTLSTVAEESTP